MTSTGADAGCPLQFTVCLTHENSLNLVSNVEALETYAGEAERRCYVGPDGGM